MLTRKVLDPMWVDGAIGKKGKKTGKKKGKPDGPGEGKSIVLPDLTDVECFHCRRGT